MRHLHWTLLTLGLTYIPLLGQASSHEVLRAALTLENRGNFESAAQAAELAITQLSGAELGMAYVILAVARQGEGKLTEAQIAFEHSLRVVERNPEHVEEYALALENYAGFYADLGQFEIATRMWLKAVHLRQQRGDHTGVILPLTHLAGWALARNKVREAQEYLRNAADEMKRALDLNDDDRATFFEAQGGLALVEHHAPEAIALYQQALEIFERSRGQEHWLCGWEHMLRGKAYAQLGDLNRASADMQRGLAILGETFGPENPRYFIPQIAYSQVLGRMGSHAKAAAMRASAERARKFYSERQCAGCTINVAAFR